MFYKDFPDFTKEDINRMSNLFASKAKPTTVEGFMELQNMKLLLEHFGVTQTHLEAKNTYEKYAIAEPSKGMSRKEFLKLITQLLIKENKINKDAILQIAAKESVEVESVGVGGAARFFEAKVKAIGMGDEAYRAFEDKKRELEERRIRQEEFNKKREAFNSNGNSTPAPPPPPPAPAVVPAEKA